MQPLDQLTVSVIKMKYRFLTLFMICVLTLVGCTEPAPNPADLSWEPFTQGDFSVDLPDWDKSESEDDQVIFSISSGPATFWVKPWPLIPRIVVENVGLWAEKNDEASVVSEKIDSDKALLDITIKNGFQRIRLRTHLVYCDGITYEVTGATSDRLFESYASLFNKALGSARCDRSGRPLLKESGALGMVILPQSNDQNEFNLPDYQKALALARESGVQVSHYYVQWGEIETVPGVYDWTIPDYILEATNLEGLQISVVINVIHTTVLGRVPPDLVGITFDDPRFSSRLTQFLTAFADRYDGKLHYLSIGNEVNDYFFSHPGEVEPYAAAFDQARSAIHQNHPELPVGIVFAYHDAETQGTLDVVKELNHGDFIAFTLYLYNDGFHFTRDPGLIGEYMDRMIDLADGTPIAIVETGWSTAEFLDGNETDQAEYVRQIFAALKERGEHFHFLSWFVMHDSRRDFCAQQALTFFEPGTEPDPEFMEPFVTFLCYFGLRESDGSPKPAWEVWVEEARRYYQLGE